MNTISTLDELAIQLGENIKTLRRLIRAKQPRQRARRRSQ